MEATSTSNVSVSNYVPGSLVSPQAINNDRIMNSTKSLEPTPNHGVYDLRFITASTSFQPSGNPAVWQGRSNLVCAAKQTRRDPLLIGQVYQN